jgi:hypothetical protein
MRYGSRRLIFAVGAICLGSFVVASSGFGCGIGPELLERRLFVWCDSVLAVFASAILSRVERASR